MNYTLKTPILEFTLNKKEGQSNNMLRRRTLRKFIIFVANNQHVYCIRHIYEHFNSLFSTIEFNDFLTRKILLCAPNMLIVPGWNLWQSAQQSRFYSNRPIYFILHIHIELLSYQGTVFHKTAKTSYCNPRIYLFIYLAPFIPRL